MKPFPLFYLLLLFCTYFEMSAQTKELPWYFSINVNAISLQGEALESGLNLGAPAFVIGRSLFENVSFGSQYALSRVDNFEQSFNYISLDGFLKFNLLNGVVVPYLIGGYGFSQFSNVLNRTSLFPSAKTSKTVFGGIGFNLYLNSNLALNVQVSYRENLLKIKELLESHPEGILLIEGYASAEGEQDYNLELSVNRAQAVRKYLITLGVDPSRLEVQGFGTSDPIGDNSRPEGRAINRRVQFKTKKN